MNLKSLRQKNCLVFLFSPVTTFLITKTTSQNFFLLLTTLLFLKILPFTHGDLKAQVFIKDKFGIVPVIDGQLNSPTAMAFLPDGRIIICDKGGKAQLVKNGK